MDSFKILVICVIVFGVMFLFWMVEKRVNTWSDLGKALKSRIEEYNLIPYTRWYIRIKFNKPKKWGYHEELIEYAQFHRFYFYIGEIYLNDWRHDS